MEKNNHQRLADPSKSNRRANDNSRTPGRPDKPVEPRADQGSGLTNTPSAEASTSEVRGDHSRPITNQDEQRKATNTDGSSMNEEETEGDPRLQHSRPSGYDKKIRNAPK